MNNINMEINLLFVVLPVVLVLTPLTSASLFIFLYYRAVKLFP